METTTSDTLIHEADLSEKQKAMWLKALSACELRNFDYAMSLLSEVVRQQPKFLDGRRALRKAAALKKGAKKKGLSFSTGGLGTTKVKGLMKKDPLAAIEKLEEILEKDPHNGSANDALYDASLMANLPETAAFALETIKEGNPDNTRNLHKLAEHYLKHDDPDNAMKTYGAIVRLDPTDMDAVKGEKDASAQASMRKQGWGDEGGAKKKDDEEAKELEAQARTVMTEAQIDEQLARLASEYDERNQDLNYAKEMAGLYEKKEDLPNAIQWYQWAFGLSDSDPSLERRIALLQERSGEMELKQLQDEIEADPSAPDVEEKRALLEEKQRERSLGLIDDARRRVEKNPTDKSYRFELGQHLFNAGEYTEAIPELQQARLNPHIRIRAMLMLGQCFERKNMLDMAAGQLKEASAELQSMDDTKKDVLYQLGLVYERMGDQDESLNCMKQIYEADYGYRDVAKRVEESYGGDSAPA